MKLMVKKQNKPNIRILIETLVILAIVVIFSFILPQMKGFFELIPIAYFLIQRRLQKRSFEEIGFKFGCALKDVKDNWYPLPLY